MTTPHWFFLKNQYVVVTWMILHEDGSLRFFMKMVHPDFS